MKYVATMAIVVVLGAPVRAQDPETPEYGCDRSAIQWILPGHFSDARKQAKEQDRLIMIKGVSFGIDATGATCATKGTW